MHGVRGLDAIDAVVLSPDERHVYTAAFLDHALAVFARDAASGSLTFVQSVEDEVDGLAGVHGVIVSPDGAHVYAAAFYEDEISIFARDAATGALAFRGTVGEADGGGHLDGVFSLAISPDGAWLYAAAPDDNAVTVFARDAATGALTFAASVVDDAHGVDGLAGVFQITLSPDGAHLYAAGGSLAAHVDNAIAVFARDATSGALTFVEATFPTGLDRAHSIEVSPDGRSVYVASFYTNRVLVFARDAATGTLAQVQEVADGAGGVLGLAGPHATAVTPDGTRLHVAGFWSGALASFARDTTTGMLTFLGFHQNGWCHARGLGGVRSLALAAGGTQLYAAGEFDDSVSLYREVVAGRCVADGPTCLALRDARAWAVVASQRAETRPLLHPTLATPRVHGSICGGTASMAATTLDGEVAAVDPHRGAASFRRLGQLRSEAPSYVVTGGGAIRGAAWIDTPVVDTSGMHPAVGPCEDSIGDIAGVGIELGTWSPTLALGSVRVRAGETRTVDARGATVVAMDALVLDDAPGAERDGDCRATTSGDVARLELQTDPGAQLVVNVSGPVRLGACHLLRTAPGAVVVLHAVGAGEPVTIDDAAVATPDLVVLAPERRVEATRHAGSSTSLGNVFGRKVKLRGGVEVTATCAN